MKKNWWIVHDDLKDVVKSIDDKNKALENSIMNINFAYNIVGDAVAAVRIKNETLWNIALKQNFRNEHIRKNVSDENMRFSIK